MGVSEYSSIPTYAGCPHCGEPVEISAHINEILEAFITALLDDLPKNYKARRALQLAAALCREEVHHALDRGFHALSVLVRDEEDEG